MWKGNPATDALEICTFSWNNMEAACYILKEFVLRAQSDSAERKQMLEPKTRNSCGYQTINWRKYIYHVSLFLNYECISQEQDMLRSFIFGSCFLLQWQFQSVQSIQIDPSSTFWKPHWWKWRQRCMAHKRWLLLPQVDSKRKKGAACRLQKLNWPGFKSQLTAPYMSCPISVVLFYKISKITWCPPVSW